MVFLRKKRRSTVSVTTRSELGHSLSLPDLTTPLIDEASWEELPAFAKVLPSMSNTIGKSQGKHHTLGIVTSLASAQSQTEFGALGYSSPARVSGTHIAPRQSATVSGPVTITPSAPAITSSPSRNRSPSLISAKGAGSPIAFHRPFRGDNVFSPPLTAPPVPSYTFPHGADFRKSAAGWSVHGHGQAGEMEGDGFSTIGSVRPHSMSGRRKRGKGKAVQERLNVIIAGGRGAGKTSLIRLLSSEPPKDPSPNHSHSQDPTSASPLTTDTQTPSSPTSPGPPLSISLPGAASSLSSPLNLPTTKRLSVKRLSNPAPVLNEPAPTQRLSSHQALIPQPHLQRNLAVRFIDTPGLDVQEDDGPAVHTYIRERGVGSLLGLVEQQCEGVLREESRVIRRGTAGADELVHLCLYLIDARRVLHSATTHIEPDWSFQGLFINDDNALSPVKSTNTARPVSSITIQPHIPSADMQTIRSLKKRMTVLPVLTYADCLSQPELASVKEAVRRDMAAAFPDEEGAGFGLFGATEDAQEPDSPVIGIHHTPNPPTPALTETSIIAESEMPYAIFCPSVSVLQSNTDGDGSAAGTRDFAWGQAKVWDGDHSDLMKLRESIFEVNTKALKVHTRQVLYERFRTERLLAHRARRGIPEE